MQVTVLKAERESQPVQVVYLAAGSTVREALLASGWWQAGSPVPPLAVFGRAATLATVLVEGDRVEWLRPLTADPKDQRRAKVAAARRARRSRQGDGLA